MEAPALLWKQWTHQVKEVFPNLHGHQQKSLAFAGLAMILAGHAVLQRMAEEISLQEISEAKMPSIERRLQRLIANERIDVAACWKSFLEQVLPFGRTKKWFSCSIVPLTERRSPWSIWDCWSLIVCCPWPLRSCRNRRVGTKGNGSWSKTSLSRSLPLFLQPTGR